MSDIIFNARIETRTKEQARSLMEGICRRYDIKLDWLSSKDGRGGYNYAECAGKCVMIAPFRGKNPVERQLIAFFHELSHVLLSDEIPGKLAGYSSNNSTKMQFELWVTMMAIQFAREKFNITFSDDAVQWLISQGFSYSKQTEGDVDYCTLKEADNTHYSLYVCNMIKIKEIPSK